MKCPNPSCGKESFVAVKDITPNNYAHSITCLVCNACQTFLAYLPSDQQQRLDQELRSTVDKLVAEMKRIRTT